MITERRREPDWAKGLLAGVAGGLLASFLMEQFQSLWSKAAQELKPDKSDRTSKSEPATVKAAEAISQTLTQQKIPEQKTPVATMHYAMGRLQAQFTAWRRKSLRWPPSVRDWCSAPASGWPLITRSCRHLALPSRPCKHRFQLTSTRSLLISPIDCQTTSGAIPFYAVA